MGIIFSILSFSAVMYSCKKESSIVVTPPSGGSGNPGPLPGDTTGNHGTPSPVPLKIKVKAAILVGNILYDSIPATLHIVGVDSLKTLHDTLVELKAGQNEIELKDNYVSYILGLSKWGVADKLVLQKSEIRRGMLVTLGGKIAAKLLKSETDYVLTGNVAVLQGRTEYRYNENGLAQIDYYQKTVQKKDLVWTITDMFRYVDGQLTKIERFDNQDRLISATDFLYGANGKITKIHQSSGGVETDVQVYYSSESGYQIIQSDLAFDNGHRLTYILKLLNGNKLSDRASNTRGGSESGSYTFDNQVNPYAHMNWPDIFFARVSKNNIIGQEKSYAGAYPSADPYKFEYSYNNDGYPVELLKSYRSVLTGEHLYQTKTIYNY
jgi:hypothetical protein